MKREEILVRLGALDKGESESKKKEDDDDGYGDDFDDSDKKGGNEDIKPCGASDWSIESRRKGLKFLLDITKEAQQEQYLKGLLANGSVPDAPKLWEGVAPTSLRGSQVRVRVKEKSSFGLI
jgi:hypothetical protein